MRLRKGYDRAMTDSQDAAAKQAASTPLGEQQPGYASSALAARVVAAPRTHEQKIELYLKTIAWFTGIVAAAVIVNVIAAIVIGAAAGAHAGF